MNKKKLTSALVAITKQEAEELLVRIETCLNPETNAADAKLHRVLTALISSMGDETKWQNQLIFPEGTDYSGFVPPIGGPPRML